MGAIILFDGVCNFCNSSVQFIIKRDPTGYFKFASLQSDTGQQLLKKYGVSKEIDSLIVIEKQSVYIKSSAALQISRKLTGFWRFFSILRVFPPLLEITFTTWWLKIVITGLARGTAACCLQQK